MVCVLCQDSFSEARQLLGFRTCLSCGEKQAKKIKHCIVPLNKSNYVPITDKELLKQLNPKRTT